MANPSALLIIYDADLRMDYRVHNTENRLRSRIYSLFTAILPSPGV